MAFENGGWRLRNLSSENLHQAAKRVHLKWKHFGNRYEKPNKLVSSNG